jgi:hypothetical protein
MDLGPSGRGLEQKMKVSRFDTIIIGSIKLNYSIMVDTVKLINIHVIVCILELRATFLQKSQRVGFICFLGTVS